MNEDLVTHRHVKVTYFSLFLSIMVNWCKRLLSASHCWGHGVAELMKTSCPQWALVQQVTVLVISTVQHLMNNNAHSLVREFLMAPPFRGMAVTCRVIIAFSKSQLIWERITVLTQVVRGMQPKNQLSSLGEIFLGFCEGGLSLKKQRCSTLCSRRSIEHV